ncbi:iron transporter [Halostella sp. PRR32]|uniref:iron transporter n=1 Tax=Halostella sp. PRR32 TaxID=3098147 RepID=UPI002B1E0D4C|nr:iron transporter [Halostella sp. PRR32]
MKRRRFLTRTAALVSGGTLAGCLSSFGFETESAWRDPPLVDDRPDAVYYPAIVEGMGTYGMTEVNGYKFALMYSFPHRFWTVTQGNRNKVVVESDDSLHLMASVWDVETETVLPIDMSLEIRNDDGVVSERAPWPMLSQSMGFHYGDNVALPSEGEYTATLRVSPMQTNRTGAFSGRFSELQTAEIPFEFDTDEAYGLDIDRLEDRRGQRGAVEPAMDEMPVATAPAKADLPGRILGEATSGDAVFVVSVLEDAARFGGESQSYLAVSPRTPYNRITLPLMSVSATLTRNGETVYEGPLGSALDPELGYHYGTAVDETGPGDTLTITVDAPPQVSRHDGYETAFLDMPPMEIQL